MVRIKNAGEDFSRKNKGNVGRSLEFCGLGDKRRAVSVHITKSNIGNLGRVSLYGLMGLLDRYDLQEILCTWGDFLQGGELYISNNVLVVRTIAAYAKDREEGLSLARKILKNGNPHFSIIPKLDKFFDVDASIDEDSTRVAYFRMDGCASTQRLRKVMMKVSFGIRVRLSKPLKILEQSFLDKPYSLNGDENFYSVLKLVLENPGEYLIDRKRQFLCRKPKNDQELYRLFALKFGFWLCGTACLGGPYIAYLRWIIACPGGASMA